MAKIRFSDQNPLSGLREASVAESRPHRKQEDVAEWVERARELSPRSGDTIEVGGVVVMVRKVRRNRVAEAVVRPVGSGTGGTVRAPH